MTFCPSFGKGVEHAYVIGLTTVDPRIKLSCNAHLIIDEEMTKLRDTWEATSFQLDKRQANPKCVEEEQSSLALRQVDRIQFR